MVNTVRIFCNMQVLQFILAVLDVTKNEDHDHELLDQCTESGTSCYGFVAEKRLTVSY